MTRRDHNNNSSDPLENSRETASQPAVRPGNPWQSPLAPGAGVEPANKLKALQAVADALTPGAAPAPDDVRIWIQRCIATYAVSTGSSLESILGLKRSGIPSPHRVAHIEARDAHIRHIARALPTATPTEKAHRIAAIIRSEAPAPCDQVDELVGTLRERFPDDIPASERSYERILGDADSSAGTT